MTKELIGNNFKGLLMKTLCIVPCGSQKIWSKNPDIGPVKAKYVYIGPFSRKCQEYAQTFYAEDWCIISAKYGFLFPGDIVKEPYNVCFSNLRTNPISLEVLRDQVKEKELDKYEKIIVLGGKNYTKMVKLLFTDKAIYTPLSDCKGIGYMMGKLNSAIKMKKSLEK